MTEDAAATAEKTEGEEKPEEEKSSEETEGKQETTEEKLGPEGEKALNAFKSRARKAEKGEKELRERLEKIESENKSETEKALDKARKEAKAEAQSEFDTERRSTQLEVAVAGHARELADVDLTVLALKQGDTDDLFDDEGKVIKPELKKRLEALLKDKPHLKASGVGKPQGEADGGKGEGGGGESFNDQLRRK